MDLASLTIPETLGHVVESWQPPDQPPHALVIHLQDLHTHAEAQHKISELIGLLHDRYGMTAVALEGAEGLCDTTLYSDLPDPDSTARVARVFLQEGLVSGAEYYAITHPGAVMLWGVEDQKLYEAHLRAYREGYYPRLQLTAWLARVQQAVAQAKRQQFPETLRALAHVQAEYEAGHVTFKRYFDHLLTLATTQQMDLADYPALERLQQWHAYNAATDMAAVDREHQALVAALTQRLVPADRATLFAAAEALASGQNTPLRYYTALKRLAESVGVDLAPGSTSSRSAPHILEQLFFARRAAPPATAPLYPNLARYIQLLLWSADSSSQTLSHEVEALTEAVTQRLAADKTVVQLLRLDKQLHILQGLIDNRLSPDEWRYYQAHEELFSREQFLADLAVLQGAVVWDGITLLPHVEAFLRFYDVAHQRDSVLVENTMHLITQSPTELSPSESLNHPIAQSLILIAGGFHTPGITRQLQERHIAYVVIAPEVHGDVDEVRYHARVQQVLPPLPDLLRALERNTLAVPQASQPGTWWHRVVSQRWLIAKSVLVERMRATPDVIRRAKQTLADATRRHPGWTTAGVWLAVIGGALLLYDATSGADVLNLTDLAHGHLSPDQFDPTLLAMGSLMGTGRSGDAKPDEKPAPPDWSIGQRIFGLPQVFGDDVVFRQHVMVTLSEDKPRPDNALVRDAEGNLIRWSLADGFTKGETRLYFGPVIFVHGNTVDGKFYAGSRPANEVVEEYKTRYGLKKVLLLSCNPADGELGPTTIPVIYSSGIVHGGVNEFGAYGTWKASQGYQVSDIVGLALTDITSTLDEDRTGGDIERNFDPEEKAALLAQAQPVPEAERLAAQREALDLWAKALGVAPWAVSEAMDSVVTRLRAAIDRRQEFNKPLPVTLTMPGENGQARTVTHETHDTIATYLDRALTHIASSDFALHVIPQRTTVPGRGEIAAIQGTERYFLGTGYRDMPRVDLHEAYTRGSLRRHLPQAVTHEHLEGVTPTGAELLGTFRRELPDVTEAQVAHAVHRALIDHIQTPLIGHDAVAAFGRDTRQVIDSTSSAAAQPSVVPEYRTEMLLLPAPLEAPFVEEKAALLKEAKPLPEPALHESRPASVPGSAGTRAAPATEPSERALRSSAEPSEGRAAAPQGKGSPNTRPLSAADILARVSSNGWAKVISWLRVGERWQATARDHIQENRRLAESLDVSDSEVRDSTVSVSYGSVFRIKSSTMVFEFASLPSLAQDSTQLQIGRLYARSRLWLALDFAQQLPTRLLVQASSFDLEQVRTRLHEYGLHIPVVALDAAEIQPTAYYHSINTQGANSVEGSWRTLNDILRDRALLSETEQLKRRMLCRILGEDVWSIDLSGWQDWSEQHKAEWAVLVEAARRIASQPFDPTMSQAEHLAILQRLAASAAAPGPGNSQLPPLTVRRYTRAGDTSIHLALYQARELLSAGHGDAAQQILLELVRDLWLVAAAQAHGQDAAALLVTVTEKWDDEARWYRPSGVGDALHMEDLADVVRDAETLLTAAASTGPQAAAPHQTEPAVSVTLQQARQAVWTQRFSAAMQRLARLARHTDMTSDDREALNALKLDAAQQSMAQEAIREAWAGQGHVPRTAALCDVLRQAAVADPTLRRTVERVIEDADQQLAQLAGEVSTARAIAHRQEPIAQRLRALTNLYDDVNDDPVLAARMKAPFLVQLDDIRTELMDHARSREDFANRLRGRMATLLEDAGYDADAAIHLVADIPDLELLNPHLNFNRFDMLLFLLMRHLPDAERERWHETILQRTLARREYAPALIAYHFASLDEQPSQRRSALARLITQHDLFTRWYEPAYVRDLLLGRLPPRRRPWIGPELLEELARQYHAPPTVSLDELRRTIRGTLVKAHPDRQGSAEEFTRIQNDLELVNALVNLNAGRPGPIGVTAEDETVPLAALSLPPAPTASIPAGAARPPEPASVPPQADLAAVAHALGEVGIEPEDARAMMTLIASRDDAAQTAAALLRLTAILQQINLNWYLQDFIKRGHQSSPTLNVLLTDWCQRSDAPALLEAFTRFIDVARSSWNNREIALLLIQVHQSAVNTMHAVTDFVSTLQQSGFERWDGHMWYILDTLVSEPDTMQRLLKLRQVLSQLQRLHAGKLCITSIFEHYLYGTETLPESLLSQDTVQAIEEFLRLYKEQDATYMVRRCLDRPGEFQGRIQALSEFVKALHIVGGDRGAVEGSLVRQLAEHDNGIAQARALTQVIQSLQQGELKSLSGSLVWVFSRGEDNMPREDLIERAAAFLQSDIPSTLESLQRYLSEHDFFRTDTAYVMIQVVTQPLAGKVLSGMVLAETNTTMLEAKMEFAKAFFAMKGPAEVCRFLINEALPRIPREERLAFVRQLTSALNNRVMQREDTLEDWQLFLSDYRQRFGLLANRDLIVLHRALSRGVPLEGPGLQQYGLAALGVTTTGPAGLEQLERNLNTLLARVIAQRTIKVADVASPIAASLIGGLTGFYTSAWGHGAGRSRDLKTFVEDFYAGVKEGRVTPLDPAFAREGAFLVRQRGQAHWTGDAQAAFEEYATLIREAIHISQQPAVVQREHLRQQATTVLEHERGQLRTTLAALTEDAPAAQRRGMETRLQAIKAALAQVTADSAPLLDMARWLVPYKACHKVVALLLVVETFHRYPTVVTALQEALGERISMRGLSKLIELRNDVIKNLTLAQVPSKEKRALLDTLRVDLFQQELARIGTLESGAVQVSAFATKGVLGELAGDIVDACYTAEPDIMRRSEPSAITAILFTTGTGAEAQLVGSMLLLENSAGGQPLLILRAVNPSAEFLTNYSAEDFLEGVLRYVEPMAAAKGARVVAPIKSPGSLSNRDEVNKAFEQFVVGNVVTLDKVETFNGHDLTRDMLAPVQSRHARSTTSGPSSPSPASPDSAAPAAATARDVALSPGEIREVGPQSMAGQSEMAVRLTGPLQIRAADGTTWRLAPASDGSGAVRVVQLATREERRLHPGAASALELGNGLSLRLSRDGVVTVQVTSGRAEVSLATEEDRSLDLPTTARAHERFWQRLGAASEQAVRLRKVSVPVWEGLKFLAGGTLVASAGDAWSVPFLLGLVIPALYAVSFGARHTCSPPWVRVLAGTFAFGSIAVYATAGPVGGALSYFLLTGAQIGFNWSQHASQSSSSMAEQLGRELDDAAQRIERSGRAAWWQRLLQGGS